MTFCLLFSFVVNITRDIEIKNIVTIARGEWGGDSGERDLSIGATIKDTRKLLHLKRPHFTYQISKGKKKENT